MGAVPSSTSTNATFAFNNTANFLIPAIITMDNKKMAVIVALVSFILIVAIVVALIFVHRDS